MNNEILLAKLPKFPGVEKDFFGIGYFSEEGKFIFVLLTPDLIKNFPVRSIDPEKWEAGLHHDEKIQILGNIIKLPNP